MVDTYVASHDFSLLLMKTLFMAFGFLISSWHKLNMSSIFHNYQMMLNSTTRIIFKTK